MNARIADLIRENRADEISDAIAEGDFFKMQTFTQALIDLVVSGEVEREVAADAATNRHDFLVALDRRAEAAGGRTSRQSLQAAARLRSRTGSAACASSGRASGETARVPSCSWRSRPRGGRARGDDATSSRVVAGDDIPPSRRRPTGRDGYAERRLARPAGRGPERAARCRRRTPVESSSSPTPSCSTSGSERGSAYGVPWNVLAAINKIESNFGRNMGPSSAGAIGWMQFMPSTWLRWGTDADGNGIADPWNPVDAVYSAARYLAASGAASRHPAGGLLLQPRVVVRRRRDAARAAVRRLGDAADRPGSAVAGRAAAPAGADDAVDQQAVFALDRLQAQLDDATAAVTEANDAYEAAVAKAQELAGREQAAAEQADSVPLLSDRLIDADGRRPGRASTLTRRRPRPTQLQERARRRPGAARPNSSSRRRRRRSTSRRGQVLSAAPPATARANYVFPVGGGPSVVSVSHTHHDYPAADIAAPEGSPLYALIGRHRQLRLELRRPLRNRVHDAGRPTARPGRTATSRTCTPRCSRGATLTAGQPVGLVGSTGARDRAAPPSPAPAGDLVPAGSGLVPVLRRDRVPRGRTRRRRRAGATPPTTLVFDDRPAALATGAAQARAPRRR